MTDPVPAPGADPRPGLVAGRYELGEPIGRGGRSVVYDALDPLLNRHVAIKLFRSTAVNAEEIHVQETEARLIAGLNHYALTTLFDAGVDTSTAQPRIYLVMERIPGVDLRERIHRDGPLTPAQLAYLGFDLAEGLQYLHESGFLHRDIKPANVLLADRHLTNRVRGKLTDFGISSIIGIPELGEMTTGTAAYLSPEQVNGQQPTTASDVYALGLVLLEALTGQVAYPGGLEESAFARLDRDAHIPPSVPPALRDILRRMTTFQTGDRPPLTEVALSFQNALVQDLINAGRVNPHTLAENEDQRLAAVRRYNILDTPADEAFDRITYLACRLLDVPIAFVSIVDADREWFKSRHGIDTTELPRDVALCATAVATGKPVTIADVQTEPAFARNPLVRNDTSLHGFVAVPMRTHDGQTIGTLCLLDHRTRTFTEHEIADLQQLAAIAIRELDLRLASRRALFNT